MIDLESRIHEYITSMAVDLWYFGSGNMKAKRV